MLHTKFRGNRPAGSGEEEFLSVFTIYRHGIILLNFHLHVPKSLHTKFG